MKLYARTPAGTGLGITVILTGRVREKGGWIRQVEVKLPRGCDQVVGFAIEPLPTSSSGDQLLWTDPGDLCSDDGDSVNQATLCAEVARINEQHNEDARRGPLGENWP